MKFSQSFYQLAKRAVKPEVGKLKFNFKKHFIQNPPDLKVYSMEDLGHPGDHRFGYTDSFRLLDDEACDYILALTKNEEYLKKKRNMSQTFLHLFCEIVVPMTNFYTIGIILKKVSIFSLLIYYR